MANARNKARVPRQKRGIETRDKIIEAAMALFSEKGYHKTNALEIAARANLATGTFYSYFNNKKEVLIEIIRRVYDTSSRKVLSNYVPRVHKNRADNYREGRKMVRLMLERLYSAHEAPPDLYKEIIAMTLLDREIEEINRAEEGKVIAFMAASMARYRDQVRVTDFEAAAALVYRASEEIIHQIKIRKADTGKKRLMAELEDMICRYLLKDN